MTYLNRANITIAYLVLILLLGGASKAGFAGNALLQLCGAVLIAWTLWRQSWGEGVRTGLGWFGLAFAILAVIQFVPLPPSVWVLMPGRETVARGYDLLGGERPWLMYSLGPWKSLASLTWWIPALAIFVALRSQGAPTARMVIWAVVGVALVTVPIGLIQKFVGSGYFYAVTNFGQGPGFFANSNHQGSFLLVALALWSGHALSGNQLADTGSNWREKHAVTLTIGAILAIGVLVSGSLACVALLVPTIAGIFLIARPSFAPRWPALAGAAAILVLGFLAMLFTGVVDNDLMAKSGTPAISRREFLATGLPILRDFAPFGSGIGTFPNIYPWYESADLVGTTTVNHAHDDLLELLIDTGIFGLATLATFLWWFARRTIRLWRLERNHTVALAASLVIGTELIHSLVDYPLRTAAMSSIVALAAVLLVRPVELPQTKGQRRKAQASGKAQNKPLIRI